MESGVKSLASRKQLLAAIVAAGLLVAIFVPFQRAEAATVNFEADGSALSGQTIPKSGAGKEIVIEITLAPGESLDKDLPVTLVPGLPNPADQAGIIDLLAETFTPTPSTGTPESLFTNISVDVDTTAYGYGYGYATTSGFVGPVTITITLTLKTSFLHQGPPGSTEDQTLTLDINGTPFDVDFEVGFSAGVATTTTTGPGPKTVTTGSGKTIIINPTGGASGTVVVVEQTLSGLSSIFSSVGTSTATLSIGTSTLQTIGDPFEIDAEGLVFPVDITISYNPSLLPSGVPESAVKFLHFDEDTGEWEDVTISRNPGQNTVTGRLLSLSPVVAGADPDDAVTPSGGGGGGGGRGPVVVSWPAAQTLPESHFALFPLDKIRVASSAFINAAGISIAEGRINQQISVSGEFTNFQDVSQNYAFIVQVTDENGFVTDISWQESIIGSGSTSAISVLWTPETDGVYSVKIFVWDGISDTPQPLSSVTVKRINISE